MGKLVPCGASEGLSGVAPQGDKLWAKYGLSSFVGLGARARLAASAR
jgi:hypothetical protein